MTSFLVPALAAGAKPTCLARETARRSFVRGGSLAHELHLEYVVFNTIDREASSGFCRPSYYYCGAIDWRPRIAPPVVASEASPAFSVSLCLSLSFGSVAKPPVALTVVLEYCDPSQWVCSRHLDPDTKPGLRPAATLRVQRVHVRNNSNRQ